MRLVIRNCHWLDTDRMEMRPEATITVEGGRIAAIGAAASASADQTIDAKGRFVIPGLIDSHVHFRLATMDFRKLAVLVRGRVRHRHGEAVARDLATRLHDRP
jgi:dihydroorotase-like cyclic amidohydrolase